MDTSVDELEEARQALLAQLKNTENGLDELDEPTVEQDAGREDAGGKNSPGQQQEASTEPSTSTEDEHEVMSPKQSRLLAMGTPVSIRYSSFSSLPSRDKFAQNMGDLELFENLPNSTGTYKKMRSLLQKVRSMFKKK